MILDGKTITEKGYVTFPKDTLFDTEEQLQPNGVDLRLHEVRHVGGRADLPRDGRIDAQSVTINEITPKNGWFELDQMHGNYLVDFMENIRVPERFCAIIITRSSLVRVGCDFVTGLWDSGFSGRLGASVRLRNPVRIQYGARAAQVVFQQSTFRGHTYNGAYQGTSQSEFK